MKRIGLLTTAGALITIAVTAILLHREWNREVSWAQTASIRTVNTAYRAYAETYPALGFPRRLDQLASPPQGHQVGPEHSGLVDNLVASGRKSGSEFSYFAERAESGRTVGYTLSVRPQIYGKTGTRSFYTDQTGTIRFTDEDRPATASDSRLH